MSRRAWLAVLLAAALVVRLAASALGALPGDVRDFHEWMVVLTTEPVSEFYALSGADHLPGDVAVIWAVANIVDWVEPGPLAIGQAEVVLESIAIASDLIAGAICFWIGERLRPGAGPLAAGLYLFNPGFVLSGTVWGQIDALSAMLALGFVAALLARRFVIALPCLAWAALIKPGFAVLLPLVLLALRGADLRRDARDVAVGAAVAVALAVALVVPFDTALGPLGSGDQLSARIERAIDRTPVTSANAFNLWTLAEGTPGALSEPGRPHLPAAGFDDRDAAAFGISSQNLGAGLAVLGLAAVVVGIRGRRDGVALLWAAMAAFVVLWLLPTRIHERYLFPAIAFGAPLAAIGGGRIRALWAALATGWLLNLLWIYDLAHGGPDLPLLDSDAVRRVLALLMLAVGLAVVLSGPPRPIGPPSRSGPAEPAARTAPAGSLG